jgi:hypothetical protein
MFNRRGPIRHTKSVQAMAMAIVHPEAESAEERGSKGGRGNIAPEVTSGAFDSKLLKQARTIIREFGADYAVRNPRT